MWTKKNERGLPNAILKISTFSQGGVWVECNSGTHACPAQGYSELRGNILDFVDDRIILDPTKRHCQAPWSGGDRIVLVAFVAKFHERLKPDDRKRLEGLGFSLPLVAAFPDPCETTSPTGPEVVPSPDRGPCGSSPLPPRVGPPKYSLRRQFPRAIPRTCSMGCLPQRRQPLTPSRA